MVLDNGDYWAPEGFQVEIVEDILSGVPEIMVVIPEANAKTTLLAGVNLYFADFKTSANCLVAAASREQAEILFSQAAGLVFRSPGFDKRFRVYDGYRRIVAHKSQGRVQVKAADDRTGDGAIPDLATIDEPHRARDLSLWRTWRGKVDKRGGQILGISTAGAPGSEFETARQAMHDAGESVTVGRHTRSASPESVIHDWRLNKNDDPDDLEVVKLANPLSVITVESLGRKRRSPTMTVSHWARFVCNVAADADDSWIEPAAWDDCRGEVALDECDRVILGVDIGRKKDSCAVVAAGMVDGKLHLSAKVRTPTPDRPVAVADARADVLAFAKSLKVAEVVYDPHQFQESAELLEEQGLLLVEFPQTDARMGPASETLYELIRAGRVVHDGDDVLRSHILAAVPSLTERGVRISKRKSRQHIDAAVGAVMAGSRAVAKPPKRVKPSFEVIA